mmetsp:Transcript_36420/g.58353  ORF Transcript_36420/g.58353 Transcript_36420/m.58353 type:complete len:475 (+) Transcript_36420:1-1425(+)
MASEESMNCLSKPAVWLAAAQSPRLAVGVERFEYEDAWSDETREEHPRVKMLASIEEETSISQVWFDKDDDDWKQQGRNKAYTREGMNNDRWLPNSSVADYDEAYGWREDWYKEDGYDMDDDCSSSQFSWRVYEGNLGRDCRFNLEESWREGSTTNDGESYGDPDWSEDGEEVSRCEIIGEGAYCKGHRIGGGGFADVFFAWDTTTGQSCAAKMGHDESLNWEAEVLKRLVGVSGFPALYYYGMHTQETVLVMDWLGRNLLDLQNMCGGCFGLRTVLKVADQVLQRVEALHAIGVIHRDIKPENFVIGRGNEASTIYMIDFGLASEYRNKSTRRRIPHVQHANFSGTPAYASVRAHMCEEQSWRDDLEAIGYMLVSLLRGSLPWEQDLKHRSSDEEWLEYCAKRKTLLPSFLICTGCPKEFSEYLSYCKQLKFDQTPDYQKLRCMFKKVFEREGFSDDETFEWSHLDSVEFDST